MKKAIETVTTVELSKEEQEFLTRMKKRSRSAKAALPALWLLW